MCADSHSLAYTRIQQAAPQTKLAVLMRALAYVRQNEIK